NDRVVDAVHAHRERARVPYVRLLQQQHRRALLGGGDRGHRAGRAAPDDEHVAAQLPAIGQVGDLHHVVSNTGRAPSAWRICSRTAGSGVVRGAATSTVVPVPRTVTRSPSSSASSTSWVTNTIVVGAACQTSVSRRCISARVWASSAPNGSSIRI